MIIFFDAIIRHFYHIYIYRISHTLHVKISIFSSSSRFLYEELPMPSFLIHFAAARRIILDNGESK